jgi:hypothetical protein
MRPIVAGGAVVAVIAVALLAVLLVSCDNGPRKTSIAEPDWGGADKNALAEAYAPILYLPLKPAVSLPQCDTQIETDPYAPAAVESWVGNHDVRFLRNRPLLLPDKLVDSPPTSQLLWQNYKKHYMDVLEDAHPRDADDTCAFEASFAAARVAPAVYSRVVPLGDRIALQYWFLSYFNDWSNRHEGDWELMQLVFNATNVADIIDTTPIEPEWVDLSQHTGGRRLRWEEVSSPTGNHPEIYIAAGSHSNYARKGVWRAEADPWTDGCDVTSDRRKLVPSIAGFVGTGPEYELRHLSYSWTEQDPYAWLSFRGKWGELSFIGFTGADAPLVQKWGKSPDSIRGWHEGLREGANDPCAVRPPGQRRFFWSQNMRDGDTFVDEVVIQAGDIAIFVLTWGGSEASLTLAGPDGIPIDKDSPEVAFYEKKVEDGEYYEIYRLEGAAKGAWTMTVEADEFPDGEELVTLEVIGFNPDCPGGSEDPDSDGLTSDEEGLEGTDPCHWDSDGDGVSDGDEVTTFLTDPLDPDSDDNGESDAVQTLPALVIDSAAADVGAVVEVTLSAINIPGSSLGLWTIDVGFDPDLLQPVSCEVAEDAIGVCNVGSAPDIIRITGTAAAGSTGTVPLATISFLCQSTGLSELTIKAIELLDASADEQPIDVIFPGTFECEG